MNTHFHGKTTHKKNSPYFCVVAIVLNSVFKIKNECDKYYPQCYLEEYKYEEKKEKKKKTHIKE